MTTRETLDWLAFTAVMFVLVIGAAYASNPGPYNEKQMAELSPCSEASHAR